MQECKHSPIYGFRLTKSLDESVMGRWELEQAQRRAARPRKGRYIRDDNKLILGIFFLLCISVVSKFFPFEIILFNY